jgi:hypothetical protein
MRFELSLVAESAGAIADKRDATPARKALREATDDLIHNALLIDDLPELVTLSARAMLQVATTLYQRELEPDVQDLVQATQALIEDSRTVMDRGLMLHDQPTAQCGAVMVELVIRGLCATLSVPYDDVLREVHRAQLAGENPMVRPILERAGLLKPIEDVATGAEP